MNQYLVTKLLGLVGVVALIAMVFLCILVRYVFKQELGNEQMKEISNAIKDGAMAFLKRQYKTIYILAIVVAILLGFVTKGKYSFNWYTFISFFAGAICSGIAGFIGMYVAVSANIRVAQGAKHSLNKSLQISFRGGAVTGLAVTTLSLIGVSLLFWAFGGGDSNVEMIKRAPQLIVGYGFGASFVALFAQLGGGIYTKAADVGADLVGKVEAGIPEDDPRNPAVIADLVGDNVGDCAGRGADLFESTAAENIGAMILGIALYPVFGVYGILFPLIARASGIIASIFGIFSVKTKEDKDPMKSLNKGYFITTVLCAIFLFPITKLMLSGIGEYANKVQYINFYGCAIIGLLLSFAFVYITQYYTSYNFRPVKEIAKSSLTGPATNIISGISVGLESTFAPVLVIAIAIFSSYWLGNHSGLSELGFNGGLYGTAIATMGMLSTCSYILAMDTFGPITDNAGGITEMSGAPEEMRVITDKLDACGNTTKALTKGYAVGSAALATFLLFSAYIDEVKASKHLAANAIYSVDIGKPEVFIGALIGAMVVFLFSSTAIRAVGKAAQYVILEVRRQFKEKPGIMDRKDKPDYRACVDIVTKGALKEMILPGVIVIVTPIAVGLILGAEAAGGMLMVATIVGVLMALFFNNGGGAWDNAKKFIELGNFGGKKSEAHKAGVVGDTVGDPFKDTAGPSIHVLIKLFSTITLVLATIFVTYGLM
ncbi:MULTISPECIES: sodium-translocating pyrophosphatase [unclassified Clostridium]|uniref:sodium-translocating pyrophosphatase n=1 Tax=unclassified Clostridium TaxID=2614128 RepID=UPI0013FB9458|nr:MULTISPECIES: sodium-translocating pyrophosphatase [unclassified Clostridium]MBN1045965.1 sodium-translocating pyrophosphatase [Clostridium botulinum]NFN94822.1 sodium-translocating pyrophosphatase [Clostridium botulinum]NFS96597.1 sodium-translocating pyrophosphatase [Clostridium botulinum]